MWALFFTANVLFHAKKYIRKQRAQRSFFTPLQPFVLLCVKKRHPNSHDHGSVNIFRKISFNAAAPTLFLIYHPIRYFNSSITTATA